MERESKSFNSWLLYSGKIVKLDMHFSFFDKKIRYHVIGKGWEFHKKKWFEHITSVFMCGGYVKSKIPQ